MKRSFLTLAAALCAALTLSSCVQMPVANEEVPWKDETANFFGELHGGRIVSAVTDGGIGVVARDANIREQAAVLYLDMEEDAGVTVSYELDDVHRMVKLSYQAPDGTKTVLVETDDDADANGTPVALKEGLGALILEGNTSCSLDLTVKGLDPAKVRYVNSLSPGTPDAKSLLDAAAASSAPDTADPAADPEEFIRKANRIAEEFVDGAVDGYLDGRLDDGQFLEKAADARDALKNNAREALAALGFADAELDGLMAAETRIIDDIYACVAGVMKPVKALAALNGTAYGDDNPFGAFKDVAGPIGELAKAGEKWAGIFQEDQDALRALEEKYTGRIPAGYLIALTSKGQAGDYADELDFDPDDLDMDDLEDILNYIP